MRCVRFAGRDRGGDGGRRRKRREGPWGQQAADAEGVRAALSAFYAALNARDIRAMEALWARDADPIMIHPSGP